MPSELAIVLSGGGARAAYQVGVFSAIADKVPDLQTPFLSGVSAGAINTVTLAAHPGSFKARVRSLRRGWSQLTIDQVYRVKIGGIPGSSIRWLAQRIIGRRKGTPVVRGVMDMEPLRDFMDQRVDLEFIGQNVEAGRLRAVTLGSTCYRTGETLTFVQGAEDLEMWHRAQRRGVRSKLSWDHVLASAAIPILFPAIRIGDSYYGDGSVRQAAPLAPPIHLGAAKILAVSMRSKRREAQPIKAGEYPSSAQVMAMLFHAIFLDALEADSERLERVNTLLRGANGPSPTGLRPVNLLLLRPSRDLGALARPHFSRLPPMLRTIVNSIGGHKAGSADFLSYLLFDPVYTNALMELGYGDALERWDEIERFLAE